MRHFDLIVIGTGPAGQKGAIQAAKLGKSVAIIEKNAVLGGAPRNRDLDATRIGRRALERGRAAGRRKSRTPPRRPFHRRMNWTCCRTWKA